MNINFALKLKLITLVFLVAIGSSCLAGESTKSKRKVIEFNQDTLISEIKKDEHKYERLYKYFKDMGEVGLCELLSNYVAYHRLLNKESIDQISDTEVVLSDLQTILGIVERNKKRLKFTVYSEEEQGEIINRLSPFFYEYIQALYNKENQLAEKAFEKFDRVVKSWWREMHIKNQIPSGIGITINNIINNTAMLSPHSILSPYSIFELECIAWVLSRDSSDSLIVNEQLFIHGMEEIKIGTYINFTVLNNTGRNVNGHMMLITKNGDDDFAFFDPSRGIILNLTLSELVELVNNTLKFLEENVFNNTGYINVLFNDNTKAIKGIKSKFAISSITSHFLGLRFYLS